MYRQIDKCRVCNNTRLIEVLDLGVQALTGVFPRTRSQPVTAGPLRLVKCIGGSDTCGLLQLEHTYELDELYGDNYGYRSGLNGSMVSHLRRKVERILDWVDIESDALILDIGSNDGTTLRAYPAGGYRLVGVDPTGAKFASFYPEHIRLIADFFSAETLHRHLGECRATIVTSFSMFYDLEAPLTFMKEIHDVLADEGIWISEQSYLPLMLRRNSYDTVCHEHLEYYALKQFKWMADKIGMKIVDVEFNDVNGGSASIVMAKQSSRRAESSKVAEILEDETREGLDTLVPYQAFAERVEASRRELRAFLDAAKKSGKSVSALGASTKGNVLLQYCNLTDADIGPVGEINAEKYGAFTPGSLLPITSEEEMLAMAPDYLLVLPWHFRPSFVEDPKLAGRNLLFPLPQLEVVRST